MPVFFFEAFECRHISRALHPPAFRVGFAVQPCGQICAPCSDGDHHEGVEPRVLRTAAIRLSQDKLLSFTLGTYGAVDQLRGGSKLSVYSSGRRQQD